MEPATEDEIAELLGDRADQNIVERIANLGVSLDEVTEALDDLEHQLRFGDVRVSTSPKIDEVRTILEELPAPEDVVPDTLDEEIDDDLTIREPDELGPEL